ncbi:hypothetical protein ACS3UN_04140 [Oscillospiraceae bacterium LTW-04]|nr:hypothetical protein RBH76_06325 [Oscillospiraceae bacterium MB24-C1]
MKHQNTGNIQLGAALLLCGLAFVLCLSLLLIVAHAHHTCPDVHCAICLKISHATALIRSLTWVRIFILSSILLCYVPTLLAPWGDAIMWLTGHSLVALRTRMDD